MKSVPYWLDTAPHFAGAEQGPVAGRCDVAVVGGGLTGLAAALALARRGVQVTLLEATQVMGEASGRNGGQCNNGLPHDFLALKQRFGAERARYFYRAHNAAVDRIEALAAEEHIECQFRRCGRIKLAAKPRHYEAMQRAAAVLHAEVDPEVELVAPADIRLEIDGGKFFGGILQRNSAQLHVGRFGVGLAQAAVRRGALIYEQAAVSALQRDAHGFELTCSRGVLRASNVLLATGCSTHGPWGWFRRRLAPVGSFIVVTEPLGESLLRRLLPRDRNYVTSRHIGNYFRTTPDRRLLYGGRAHFALSNPRSDRKSGRILQHSLGRMFPELHAARIDYCWGGLVDLTADRLPRAGIQQGMHFALGYSGHGVQMSVYMGEAMAAVMAGDSSANPWAGLDWPAIPGHTGKAWFLPLVGAYYRVLDLLR